MTGPKRMFKCRNATEHIHPAAENSVAREETADPTAVVSVGHFACEKEFMAMRKCV